MGSLRFSEYADSPAMILSPQHHPFDPVASYHSSLQQYHSFKPVPQIDASPNSQSQPPPTSALVETSSLTAGSKRKRGSLDDKAGPAAPSSNSLEDAPPSVNSTSLSLGCQAQPSAVIDQSIADATTMNNGVPHDATVTYVDVECNSRQKMRRRETADTLSLTTINNTIVPATPNPKAQEEAIDQFTRLLGVGWTRIDSSDPCLQQAARGWEKYIENHYPLTSATILARSKALDGAFLTLARDYENAYLRRFLLFKEDLTEGRLIASNWNICLARLQATPMQFEYDEVLRAQRTPDLTPTSDTSGDVDGLPMTDLASLPPLPTDEGRDDAMMCD